MIKIRKTTKEDRVYLAEKLQELFAMHRKFHSVYSVPKEVDIRSELAEDDISFIACTNLKEKVGFVRGRVSQANNPEESSLAVLLDMFVEENFRREGIGSKLLEAFKEEAKNYGTDFLRLQVDVKNDKAQKFWEYHGFESFQLKMSKKL